MRVDLAHQKAKPDLLLFCLFFPDYFYAVFQVIDHFIKRELQLANLIFPVGLHFTVQISFSSHKHMLGQNQNRFYQSIYISIIHKQYQDEENGKCSEKSCNIWKKAPSR